LCLFAAISDFPLPLCAFAALREIFLSSLSLSVIPLSDYPCQQWDYAFEDVLEFAWTIRPRDVPDADALDVSWRRS
jgi:hypothetical protein